MRRILTGTVAIGSALLLIMMAMIVVEVVLRGLFKSSLLVVDEYSGYLVVAITFLGIPFALRDQALLRVDVVIDRLRGRGRALAELVFDLVSFACAAALGWFLLRMVLTSYERGTFTTTPAMTPLWLPQAIMPIGIALTLLVLAGRIRASLTALRGQRDASGEADRG